MPRQFQHKRSTERARELRREETPAEAALWKLLRNRKLSNWKWRRQHPIGRFYADFACVEAKLIVELDGASHSGREEQDAARDEFLHQRGWRILRVTNEDLEIAPESLMNRIIHELHL